MKTILRLAPLAGLLAAAGILISQPAAPVRVGPQPGGGFLLNSGWLLKPAGRQIPLSTGPQATALSPNGKYLAILQAGYLQPSVSIHDPLTLAEIHRITLPDAWLGLAFSPSGLLYVSGGSTASVYELAITTEARLELRRTFTIVPEKDRKHTDFIGDVTLSPDGRLIYAAGLHRNSIIVINPQSGMIIEEWKTAYRPYRILFHPDGKSFFVTGWGDASLRQVNPVNGQEIARFNVGLQPMDMVWRTKPIPVEGTDQPAPFKERLFVTSSGSNLVHVFGAVENGDFRRIESINTSYLRDFYQPVGMTPSALALSPDQDTLYIVCADANAVARVDISTRRSAVTGFIPTGWYPLAARVLSNNDLLVLNGRGAASYPNPKGPNPTINRAVIHEGNVEVEYVGAIQRGSASLIPAPRPEQMAAYTQQVISSSPLRAATIPPANIPAGHVLSYANGAKPPIEHVIYVVKENRTYDQVLGDLGIGNGDPSLTLFTEESSPNHHKLAREFVLLDNFYVSADVSAEGHNWSTSAIAPAYVQRMWPNSYARRRRHYDYEGQERAALPPAGYIWTSALQAGLTYRNYGWWVTNISPAPTTGRQIAAVRDPAIAQHTNFDYRSFDLDYKDVDRLSVLLKDLAEFEASGQMPRFITLRLGNDHTSGTAAGKIAPLAAMADNDAALGQLVEAVSKSKFWATTAIFVLEDDAQNGPDHVDSHRSPAYVISPYTRGRGIDSSMYNTVSMLRTMEYILGLNPMTMHDASAHLMTAAFNPKPDTRPYVAEKPRISLDTRNPSNTPLARRSREFEFEEADRADDDDLNEVLWLAIKKTNPPAPVRSFWGQ